MTKAPKTTIAGLIIAIGTALSAVQEPQWIHWSGQILIGLGSLLMGFSASDLKK